MSYYTDTHAYRMHDDYMQKHYGNIYKYDRDIYNQSLLYADIDDKYDFKDYPNELYKKKAKKGTCPECGKRSCFLTATRDSNNYQLLCADKCIFKNGKKSILLYEVIKHYHDAASLEKYRNPSREKPLPYGWNPIKPENRKRKSTL